MAVFKRITVRKSQIGAVRNFSDGKPTLGAVRKFLTAPGAVFWQKNFRLRFSKKNIFFRGFVRKISDNGLQDFLTAAARLPAFRRASGEALRELPGETSPEGLWKPFPRSSQRVLVRPLEEALSGKPPKDLSKILLGTLGRSCSRLRV
jgi:hypothetical protein